LFFFVVFVFLAIIPSMAQTAASHGHGFFIAPLLEVNGYGRERPAVGCGFALGIGDGISEGFRLIYAKALGGESIDSLELSVFFRVYPLSHNVPTGLFFQLDTGAVIFAYDEAISFPAKAGDAAIGIAAGWRFSLRERWYIEPAIRAGYPYLIGVGVSGGFRL